MGAGPAGLSAAYELTKVGHDVSIVEMQNRVGGRIKTIREKDGFSKYCHSEGEYIYSYMIGYENTNLVYQHIKIIKLIFKL